MFVAFEELLREQASRGFVLARSGRKTYNEQTAVGSPAKPAHIALAERAPSVRLPRDYRMFLERWDGARLFVDSDRHNPHLFRAVELADNQLWYQEDSQLLLIGFLHDEAYVMMDRRSPSADAWPVYRADELDQTEEVLARHPIAGSFAAMRSLPACVAHRVGRVCSRTHQAAPGCPWSESVGAGSCSRWP